MERRKRCKRPEGKREKERDARDEEEERGGKKEAEGGKRGKRTRERFMLNWEDTMAEGEKREAKHTDRLYNDGDTFKMTPFRTTARRRSGQPKLPVCLRRLAYII